MKAVTRQHSVPVIGFFFQRRFLLPTLVGLTMAVSGTAEFAEAADYEQCTAAPPKPMREMRGVWKPPDQGLGKGGCAKAEAASIVLNKTDLSRNYAG